MKRAALMKVVILDEKSDDSPTMARATLTIVKSDEKSDDLQR
jgi:hypothetical protein